MSDSNSVSICRKSLRIVAVAAVSGLTASFAHAVDYQFTAAAGAPSDYNTATNWSPASVPGAGDAAFIAGGRIATIGGVSVDLLSALSLGANGGTGSGELRISGGSLTTGGVQIGHDSGTSSAGKLDLSGGAFTSTGATVLGEQGTGANSIVVSGGALTLGGETYLGANGTGSLSLSGSGLVTAARINVGNGANSVGSVTLTGGTLNASDTMYVGLRGLGTYTQSAGTATISRMQVGQENDGPSGGPPGDGKGKGTVNVSGGTLNVVNPIVLGEVSREDNQLNVSGGTVSAAEIYNGANGRGSITVSGSGTLNVVGQMHIGASGTGIGSLTVSSGNLNMTGPGGWILVGQNGQGTFNFTGGAIDTKIISVGQDPTSTGTATQSGGTLRSQRTFIVGETSTAGGTYSLSAGSIDVGTADTGDDLDGLGIFVGSYNGKGTVNITGGSLSSRTGATIGYGEGGPSEGIVNISAGTLSTVTSGDQGRVRIGVYGGATGRLNVSGTASVSFAGPVLNGVARGGVGVGGTGLITVSGGTYSSASMLNETGSSFTQTGGSSTLGPVTGGGSVAVSGGTATVASIVQGSASATGTGTLRIAPSATLTYNRVNSLTTSDTGKLDITNNGLIVDYTASSPAASIRAALAAGRIVGTLTPADPRQRVGYAEANTIGLTNYAGTDVDSTSILIRVRLAGDADLNGRVEFDDLLRVAMNYDFPDRYWAQGDFNYDGNTNFPDLLLLAQNYGSSLAIGDIGTPEFRQDWALALSLAPEPASLSVIALGAMSLRRRRA